MPKNKTIQLQKWLGNQELAELSTEGGKESDMKDQPLGKFVAY